MSLHSADHLTGEGHDDPSAPGRLHTDIRARLYTITGPAPSAQERALLARMLTTFPTKTLTALDRLARALRAAETAAVGSQAHSLKGSAANLGVTNLTRLFADLEDQARRGDLPHPEPTLQAVRDALDLATPACITIAAELTCPAAA